MDKGNIICLNGVSSSGKSTLAKSLQENLSEPYYWMSEDTFTFILPDKFNIFKNDTGENEKIWDQAIINYYHVIKMYSDRGYNVIVDGVLDDEAWVDVFVEILHDNPVLFVHVTCPEAELTRRELARGDREIGLAVEQLDYLCPKEPFYDITVDTHVNTANECADKIIALLESPNNFQAFSALWKQYNADIQKSQIL
ncbi:MAG: chloramphenicol phosphotransferase CPT family protein [Defluviitaleaceae bacterium]|nr:chloramphenicol phosphotransferase CPT family protein [Defluviitaleaceae bacterium]